MDKKALDYALSGISPEYIAQAARAGSEHSRAFRTLLKYTAVFAAVTAVVILAFAAVKIASDKPVPNPPVIIGTTGVGGDESAADANSDTSAPSSADIPAGFVRVQVGFLSNGDGTSTITGLDLYSFDGELNIPDSEKEQLIVYKPDSYPFPQNEYVVVITGGDIMLGINTESEVRKTECVVIPEGVTEIPESAFSFFTELKNVVIPQSVTKIGGYAFFGCTSLEEIILPDSVIQLGEFAFSGCTALKSVNIPAAVTVLPREVFSGCTALSGLILPDGVLEIGECAFARSGLHSLKIPDSVVSIGSSALSGCSGLEELSVPFIGASRGQPDTLDYLFSLPMYAAQPPLKSLIVTDAVTIADYAFNTDSAVNITQLTLNEGITEIGVGVLPGYGAALETFVIPNSVKTTGSLAGASVKTLYIGAGLETVRLDVNEFSALSQLYISEQNPYYCAVGTAILSKDKTVLVKYLGAASEYSVPDGVKVIGPSAFRCRQSIRKIVLPDSVTALCSGAFTECIMLSEINIPKSVLSVQADAFAGGCNSLTVYCEASERPAGWDEHWIGEDCGNVNIIWNAEEEKD